MSVFPISIAHQTTKFCHCIIHGFIFENLYMLHKYKPQGYLQKRIKILIDTTTRNKTQTAELC